MTDRVLRNTGALLSVVFLADGTPTEADGDVTVTVTRADGSELATGTATDAAAVGVYQYSLQPQATLNHLTLSWTGAFSTVTQTITTQVEIVGGFYLTTAALRALPNLGDTAKFAEAELAAARNWFEDKFESYTGLAWVPRFRRAVLSGLGSGSLILPDMYPTRLLSLRTYTTASVYTAYTSDEIATVLLAEHGQLLHSLTYFPRGTRNIVVEYEHGVASPPSDVVDAAAVAIRQKLLADNTGPTPYAVASEGLVQRFARPGPDHPFGIDDVDEAANRYRFNSGVASVGIG